MREQQQAVADVLRAVARSEGLSVVFEVALEAANRLCDGNFDSLYMVEGELLRPAAQQGGAPEQAEYERSHPHTRIGTRSFVELRRQSGRSQRAEAVHRRADRADEDVRRSGVDCDRERPAERRRRAAEDGAIALSFAQVVELVSSPDGEGLLAGHRAYISCLFCDLRCFTGFVETSEPEELVEVLHPHQSAAGALIPAYDGTLEHFASDGLMLFFNDPTPVAEHELQAIRLALALQRRFGELTTGWRKRGIDLSLGIGIAAGHATLGRIGFEGRYDYGALGPVTNLASRLSTYAGPGQVLISKRVFAAVEQSIAALPVGDIELKGFACPIPAYEVRALTALG